MAAPAMAAFSYLVWLVLVRQHGGHVLPWVTGGTLHTLANMLMCEKPFRVRGTLIKQSHFGCRKCENKYLIVEKAKVITSAKGFVAWTRDRSRDASSRGSCLRCWGPCPKRSEIAPELHGI